MVKDNSKEDLLYQWDSYYYSYYYYYYYYIDVLMFGH